jgi:hypothetical protein
LIRKIQYLFSNKEEAIITNTGIQGPAVRRVFRALHTYTSNSNISWLTKAATLIEVLVIATGWVNNKRAWLGLSVINFIVLAPPTDSFNQVIAKDAHTSLLGVRVDFILLTDNLDAISGVGQDGVPRAASALIKLRIVSLVIRAALANILNDDKAWLTLTGSIDEYLIGPTCIDSCAPLGNFIVGISLRTLATNSTDAIKIRKAIA